MSTIRLLLRKEEDLGYCYWVTWTIDTEERNFSFCTVFVKDNWQLTQQALREYCKNFGNAFYHCTWIKRKCDHCEYYLVFGNCLGVRTNYKTEEYGEDWYYISHLPCTKTGDCGLYNSIKKWPDPRSVNNTQKGVPVSSATK